MENLNLIRKIAWDFHATTKVDVDDLIQEAALAYLTKLKEFDKTRGVKFSTFIWSAMENHLINYLRKENKYHNPLTPDDILVDFVNYSESPYFERLNPDGLIIADIIMRSRKRFYPVERREARQRLIRLLTRRGWDRVRIIKGFKNLTAALSY